MEHKSQFDKMLTTPVHKLILSFSVPTILSMLVTNVYNLVDTAFVGTLGNSASGAVGIVFGFMAILQAIGFLFGQGSGSIVSRSLGAKNTQKASTTASTGFFVAFGVATFASILCYVFLNPLVKLLGSTDTIAPYAYKYITFILATGPFMVTSFTLNNILRYEGKAIYGMIGLISGAVLNIAGDALFMFVLKMGISGAGLSTAISQVVSFSILIYAFLSGKTTCKIKFSLVKFNFNEIFTIVSTGFPSLLRQGLASITTILLNKQAGVYGDAAIAAMSISSRVSFFVFSIAVGIGQGFQPVSGFSYGAKRYDRLKKAFVFTAAFSEVIMIILCLIVAFKSAFFVHLLRDDPDVILIGTRALRLQSLATLFLPLCMTSEMLMQSTGQRLLATLLSAMRSGLIFIPLLLILPPLRGLAGVQEAQPLAFIIAFLPTIYIAIRFFKRLEKKDVH